MLLLCWHFFSATLHIFFFLFFLHCFSFLVRSFFLFTRLIVVWYNHWWTPVVCKSDLPRELLQEMGKNNTEVGLMKWFSFFPFLPLCYCSLGTDVWQERQTANNYLIIVTQMQCICDSAVVLCSAPRLMWPIPPPFLTAEFSSSSPSNDSVICRLKIVPLWHIWCLFLGSHFSWIRLCCVY